MALALTSGPFSIADALTSNRQATGALGPAPAPAPRLTPVQQAQEKVAGIEKRLGETQLEAGQFEAQKQEFAARQQAEAARKQAELVGAERQAIEESEAYKSLDQISKEAAEARFQPSQRTAQENMALFGLINVLGFAIGAGGKSNAMQAMAAMNGMVEGVRRGDMDRYTREKDTFNTNLKALHDKSQMLATQVKRITELAARDKEKARLEFEALQAEQGADFVKQYASKFGLAATAKYLEQQAKGAERMLQMAQQAEQREQARIQAERERFDRLQEMQRQRLEFQAALQTQRLTAEQARLDQRLAAARAKADAATKQDKPPAKEIVTLNNARNVLIPALDEGLKVLDRINKQGDWETLTATFGLSPHFAEAVFRDDKEALELIRTFSKFRAGEFETAGKALTKTENKILAPLYQADFRVYEGIRNAMEQGLKTLKAEQRGMEDAYPYIKKYNQTIRQELGGGAPRSEPSAPAATGPKEGDRASSKSGKPMVYRGGQWVYE